MLLGSWAVWVSGRTTRFEGDWVHTKGVIQQQRFLEGFLEGSLKEALLVRILARCLVLRGILGREVVRHRRRLEGA